MTLSAAPPPTSREPSPLSLSPGGKRRAFRRQPPVEDRYPSILARAMGAAVVLHLLALLLSPFVLRLGAPPGDGAAEAPRQPAQVMRAIVPFPATPESDAAPSPEAATPLQPLPTERQATTSEPRPTAAPPADAPPPASGPTPAEAPSTAEAHPLQPGQRDSRLWVAPRELPDPPEPTDHERYMAHLKARIDQLNDSTAAEAERQRRATDWTFTDKNGKRWGISPDGIHLGDVTLPPVVPHGDRDQELERRERQRQWEEIRGQEAERERRRIREERNPRGGT